MLRVKKLCNLNLFFFKKKDKKKIFLAHLFLITVTYYAFNKAIVSR